MSANQLSGFRKVAKPCSSFKGGSGSSAERIWTAALSGPPSLLPSFSIVLLFLLLLLLLLVVVDGRLGRRTRRRRWW